MLGIIHENICLIFFEAMVIMMPAFQFQMSLLIRLGWKSTLIPL